ncbi:MAG: cyclic nucleotide-binding domain-containing protein, partial [Pseudomonadota bacterium]
VVMVLLFAAPLIAYMPKLVLGGGVIFLAFEMAVLRVRSQWRQAPAMDRALLLLVLASLLVFGFLPGIAIGILAGLALFAFSYARIDLVRVAGNGTSFRSNVHRPPAQLKSLAEHADALQVVGLQGYLFFGSTHNLLRRVKAYLVPQPRTQRAFLIFDFARVDGMDGSAVYALTRLVQQAEERGYSVMVAALPMTVANALRKAGLAGVGEAAVRAFPDLDHALEQAENAVLGIDEMVTPQSGLDELEAAYPDVGIRAQLMTYGEPVSWRPGEVAIRQGDPSDSMFFIESGRLTAWRELADGNRARLSTIVPGTVVGELGFYLRSRRAASIIADVESTAFCITRNALRRMETDDPRLASIFHRLMVIVAAERAVSNVGLLDARAGRGDEP